MTEHRPGQANGQTASRKQPDPRPTLVAYGAPLMYPPRREMPLEEAVARALTMLRGNAVLLLSLPVVLSDHGREVAPDVLMGWAREFGVEAELGMVLELTTELSGQGVFKNWALALHRLEGEPRYLDEGDTPRARKVADQRTPAVMARWGFRLNTSEEGVRQFFEKHHG